MWSWSKTRKLSVRGKPGMMVLCSCLEAQIEYQDGVLRLDEPADPDLVHELKQMLPPYSDQELGLGI